MLLLMMRIMMMMMMLLLLVVVVVLLLLLLPATMNTGFILETSALPCSQMTVYIVSMCSTSKVT